jgi:hypothetical protein
MARRRHAACSLACCHRIRPPVVEFWAANLQAWLPRRISSTSWPAVHSQPRSQRHSRQQTRRSCVELSSLALPWKALRCASRIDYRRLQICQLKDSRHLRSFTNQCLRRCILLLASQDRKPEPEAFGVPRSCRPVLSFHQRLRAEQAL